MASAPVNARPWRSGPVRASGGPPRTRYGQAGSRGGQGPHGRGLGVWLALLAVSGSAPGSAQAQAQALPVAPTLPQARFQAQALPPSPALLRSLRGFLRDVERLDQALPPELEPGLVQSPGPSSATATALALPAPAPLALPGQELQAAPRRVRLSLEQSLALALSNDPDLAAQAQTLAERAGLVDGVRGRLLPQLGLRVGGAFSQRSLANTVWDDNAGLYPAGSPFLVKPNGWNAIQINLGEGFAALRLDYELISFERGAALAEARAAFLAECSLPPAKTRHLALRQLLAPVGR